MDALLTTLELSQWLRVKVPTIRKWVCNGKIPYVKVGRSVTFKREDIELWLEQNNPQRAQWLKIVQAYKKDTIDPCGRLD